MRRWSDLHCFAVGKLSRNEVRVSTIFQSTQCSPASSLQCHLRYPGRCGCTFSTDFTQLPRHILIYVPIGQNRQHRRHRQQTRPRTSRCLHEAERSRRAGSERQICYLDRRLSLHGWGECLRQWRFRTVQWRKLPSHSLRGRLDLRCFASGELARNKVSVLISSQECPYMYLLSLPVLRAIPRQMRM